MDFEFLYAVSTTECPEYNGYNIVKCRNVEIQHHLPHKYFTDPDVIISALVTAINMIKSTRQTSIPFTWDQQLYQIIGDIIFHNPERFKNIVPILGDMHFLEAFVAAVGTLAGPLGLASVLNGAFSSVEAMLNGKKFPQNVRPLRLLVEFANAEDSPLSMDEVYEKLSTVKEKSCTSKSWIDLIIYPVS